MLQKTTTIRAPEDSFLLVATARKKLDFVVCGMVASIPLKMGFSGGER